MIRVFLLALTVCVFATTATRAQPATTAAPEWFGKNPHVHVSGHVDCGGIDTAQWMWWWASNGEKGWANLSAWTSVSRWVLPIREVRGITVQTYNLDLWNVPTSGTTLNYTIGCGNKWLGNTGKFTESFGVQRPLVGTSATRHICWRPALGCWV